MTPLVTLRTREGNLYQVWQEPLPRIPPDWLDAIVYLYPTEADAWAGKKVGATGFVVCQPPDDQELDQRLAHYYLVTNAHVVEGRQSIAARVNKHGGGFDVLTIPCSPTDDPDTHYAGFVCHPDGDDVAAAYLWIDHNIFRYIGINREMMLTPEIQAEREYGPGDDVFFMGRYIDIEGKAHNAPIVRSGIVAGFPTEPIYEPKRDHHQESILVEARSLSGFSGSPVFVTASSRLERTDAGVPVATNVLGPHCYLLGVDWGHHNWLEDVRDRRREGKPHPDLFIRTNSGIMMVVPAQKLLELLEVPKLVAPRTAKELNERKLRGMADAVVSQDSAGEPDSIDRTVDLTAKLMQVPKAEVDELERQRKGSA